LSEADVIVGTQFAAISAGYMTTRKVCLVKVLRAISGIATPVEKKLARLV